MLRGAKPKLTWFSWELQNRSFLHKNETVMNIVNFCGAQGLTSAIATIDGRMQ